MKRKLFIVAVMLVFSATWLLNAQQGMRARGHERGRQLRGMLASDNFIPVRMLLKGKEKIGLSAEQEKQLTAMNEAHAQWLIKFRADMEIQALKLRKCLAADKMNLKDAEGLIRAQADMHAEMQIVRLRFQQEVKALLSTEQLAKVNEMKKEFGAHFREGMRERREMRRERMH
ncbi:MAG: hypothetical protein JXI33_06405 [Candidatus Aminicenantes bacterium]|nr:hypothetical protein [Candidatus Aminicenantes bacterium]